MVPHKLQLLPNFPPCLWIGQTAVGRQETILDLFDRKFQSTMVPGTAGEGVVVTVNEDGKTFAASASEGLGSTPTGQPGRGRAAGSRDVAAVLCVAPRQPQHWLK